MDAVKLCTCVFEYDLPRLRRLLKAGCAVDAGDYDLRTALHICASESNLVMVCPSLPSSPFLASVVVVIVNVDVYSGDLKMTEL